MQTKLALIVTVGTGTRAEVNIVRPLVKTIRNSRPNYLVLMVTEGSIVHGEAIVRELNLEESLFDMKVLSNFDDFQSVCGAVNEAFVDLEGLGFSPNEVQIDFTSGTKAMSAGAVCSGIYNQCRSIKYITGTRKQGIVVDGSERFLTVEPSEIYTMHDVKLAQQMMLRLRFATAEEILTGVNPAPMKDSDAGEVRNLRLVAQVYGEWDRFNHSEALKRIKKVTWEASLSRRFAPTPEGYGLLQQFASDDKASIQEATLLDVYNNALRRGLERKYDDAVARFYRAVELLAQQVLSREYQVDSSDVDLNRVPSAFRSRLEQNSDSEGHIRIGLVLDYELLSAFGNPLGQHFLGSSKLQSRLLQRNSSILAHGLTPISESTYKHLHSDVLALFSVERTDFEALANRVQFSWLQEP
ncbi:MAG: TIGR02710 family CRISPR-associated CARF protein [Pseudomonadota bacterium]